ncbi:darcynin family protein [Nocardia sp. NPDC055029]
MHPDPHARCPLLWDRYFEVVDLLVGTENGYARNYGLEPLATITT